MKERLRPIRTSENKLNNFLSEHGIVFYPKRELEIPRFCSERLNLADSQQEEMFNQCSGLLTGYLRGQPIYFPAPDHYQRRVIMENGEKRFPNFYHDFKENNQFRRNVMTRSVLAMQVLSRLAKNNGSGWSNVMKDKALDILDKIHGVDTKPYNEMDSAGEKLEVVHFVEDKIIEFLKILC